MPILRDYLCKFCNKLTEYFDDDEEIELCPYCGLDGLEPTLSAPNIKTSRKSSSSTILPLTVVEPAGFAIRVNKNGELGAEIPMVMGEMFEVSKGSKVIVSPNSNPDREKLKIIARHMAETEPPPKSKQH